MSPAAARERQDRVREPRLVYVVTSPLTADVLLRGQLARLRREGFAVTLISSPGPGLERAARREEIETIAVPLRREIAPLADLRALWRLTRTLRRLAPDVVNASTPKAGLLGLLAARLARVPARVYTLRGLRLETANGWRRLLLATTERRAASSAHRVLAVSHSLARRYSELGLCPAEKIRVLAAGSSNGVRRPEPVDVAARQRLRAALGLEEDAPVVGFVGRLTRDKGIAELCEAFELLADRRPKLRLLLVGDFETGDPVAATVIDRLASNSRVLKTGFVDDPTPYYELMTVLAFPSHREGFPNAPLEAAMAGIPTVGCRVTGTVDAVVDGATGLLVPAGDAAGLAAALGRYLDQPELATAHGVAARRRAEAEFGPERVWDALVAVYRGLLGRTREPATTNQRGAGYARSATKRALDLLLALPLFLLSLPLQALLAGAVRLVLGSPVFFRQERPGLNAELFTLTKFRSMRRAHDSSGEPLPDAARLGAFGRLLRRTSLDELPELAAVVRGDLSLVGPRPLLPSYLQRYTARQARRHEVKPGLTGWAQVKGRNAVDWDERLEYDVWYVDNASLGLDIRILWMTLFLVLSGRGVAARGTVTMDEFRGREERHEGAKEPR